MVALLATIAATGCFEDSVPLGGDDAGPGGDAGAAEPCGPVTCTGGTVCCNASCGICTASDEACPAIACEPDCGDETCGPSEECCVDCDGNRACGAACPDRACPPPPPCAALLCEGACCLDCDGEPFCAGPGGECPPIACPPEECALGGDECGPGASCCPTCGVNACVDTPEPGLCPDVLCADDCSPDDARGEGACRAIVGVAWHGSGCFELSGCECVGADCGKYDTLEMCIAEHAGCDRTCGGFGGFTCLATEYCDYADGDVCGFDDSLGLCRPRPEACTEDCPGVCGCDGEFYCNGCLAASMGVDVQAGATCGSGGM